MTLEQLRRMKRPSSKLIVYEMNIDTLKQKRIFEGYETDICDQPNQEFTEFFEANKSREVMFFDAIQDHNSLPALYVAVRA